ncbi:MAG: serine/threonine-protein kinase [Polyangiales bacterium]
MRSSELPAEFGPYTLIRRLAVGGMAEVFAASVRGVDGFEKTVALKRIHEHLSSDAEFVSMLISEAKLSASLSHPNIVQTFDLGCIDETHFIVMEQVDGYDLGSVLAAMRERRERLPWTVAAYIVAELCRGLAFAHRQTDGEGRPLGIVHRDVSPQNVLLSFAGEVKVADFGIAKSTARLSDPEAGVIKGKYFYMSPEQAWGDPLDARTDIFSAAVVLWEALVGEPPREARTVQALLEEVRSGHMPAPSSRREGLPSTLDGIVADATAIEPSGRISDADVMAGALDLALGPGHAEAVERLCRLLADLRRAPATHSPPVEHVPDTRRAVRVRSTVDLATPAASPLRVSLDDGVPTVAGWRSPASRWRIPWRWIAGAAMVGVASIGVWWLGRSA